MSSIEERATLYFLGMYLGSHLPPRELVATSTNGNCVAHHSELITVHASATVIPSWCRRTTLPGGGYGCMGLFLKLPTRKTSQWCDTEQQPTNKREK